MPDCPTTRDAAASAPGRPSRPLSIEDLLAEHETRYGASAGRIFRSHHSGVYAVETKSSLRSFMAPACDFHRFNFQLSGTMSIRRFDLTRQTKQLPGHISTGSFGFIPNGTPVRAHIEGDDFHTLQVMIPRRLMQKSLEKVTGTAQDDEHMVGHIGSAGPQFLRLGQLLRTEYEDAAKGGATVLDSIAEVLCIELARHFSGGSESPNCHEAFSAEEERLVRDMIQSVIAGEANLGDVADALGMPPYRLTRLFSAHFGETPREHMLRLRLERVRETLSETTLPLTKIAYDFGFSSQSHKTTAFKNRFGTSPARYRSSALSRRADFASF